MSNANERMSRFCVDLDKAAKLWSRPANLTKSLKDLFSTRISLPCPTHYDPTQAINVILYDDALGAAQEDIGRYFRRGEVFICVKHHSPEYPILESAGKDAVKFNATHISVGVGIDATASGGTLRNGAVTINNPQNYGRPHSVGLFGDAKYPMIFLRLRFPSGLSLAEQEKYMHNIRAWLVIANTYTNFTEDYNGGDPLGTRSVKAIIMLGDKLLGAMTGTFDQREAALDWLRKPENKVYCSELAHVAVNLGIHYPLNRTFLGHRLDAVSLAFQSKRFLLDNKNHYARLVDLTVAPESLMPITDVIGVTPTEPSSGESVGMGLAFKPMTMTDLIEEFLQIVPRQRWGEAVAAPVQAALFKEVRKGLIEGMALHQLPDDEPRRQAAEALLDNIQSRLGKPATTYQAFCEGLEPLLREANRMSGPRPDGSGVFMPPHAFLLHALGRIRNEGCVMGLEVVGYGCHASILKPLF
jgi:hypothetical protein